MHRLYSVQFKNNTILSHILNLKVVDICFGLICVQWLKTVDIFGIVDLIVYEILCFVLIFLFRQCFWKLHKRDGFIISMVNIRFINCNIPTAPTYGTYTLQLIRYTRTVIFLNKAQLLTQKLLKQDYIVSRLTILGWQF